MPTILLNPHTWIAAGFVVYSAWLFNQGINFEQRREAVRTEITNKAVRVVNKDETERDEKEDTARATALGAAKPTIAASVKCIASPDLALALSGIR